MARPKSNGPYAPLSAIYYRDDAILEAGEQAELLFVRCLAFLADSASDGFITERQMRVVVGMGMRNVPGRVQSLVSSGLLTCVDGGYLMRSWLKWNKSTDEIGKHLKRDRERKQAEKVENSARNDDGFQPHSSDQITTNHITTSQINTSSSSDADAPDPEGFSDDVIRLCELLASLIRLNGNNVKTVGKGWWTSCDRLIRIDGYTAQQIEWVMRWSQSNEFWQGNILSMPKLREKFDQLKTKAMAEAVQKNAPGKQTRTQENVSYVTSLYKQQQMEIEQ